MTTSTSQSYICCWRLPSKETLQLIPCACHVICGQFSFNTDYILKSFLWNTLFTYITEFSVVLGLTFYHKAINDYNRLILLLFRSICRWKALRAAQHQHKDKLKKRLLTMLGCRERASSWRTQVTARHWLRLIFPTRCFKHIKNHRHS